MRTGSAAEVLTQWQLEPAARDLQTRERRAGASWRPPPAPCLQGLAASNETIHPQRPQRCMGLRTSSAGTETGEGSAEASSSIIVASESSSPGGRSGIARNAGVSSEQAALTTTQA